MSDGRFSRYELRTKDVLGARTFYDRLFGDGSWSERITVVPLPEQAAARGAPSHWLGCVGAPNVASQQAFCPWSCTTSGGASGPSGMPKSPRPCTPIRLLPAAPGVRVIAESGPWVPDLSR